MFDRCPRWLHRLLLIAALAAAQCSATATPAWARGPKTAPVEKEEKSYTMPYLIVVLGVALGLIVALRPVKRLDEPKRIEKMQ